MVDLTESEVVEVGDLDPDQWNDFAAEQGWSDGLPLMMPTEDKVERMVEACRGDNEPFPPMSPRRVIPTLRSIAANAVMAGCRPEYFPVVVATVRAVLNPEYNLHGTLATTHPCAQAIIVNGPIRRDLDINCGSNCFGQGHKANATIGRALQLTLLNVGGAKPGEMDRATQGSPAKYSFCFGENEEESPWTPYHVRRGFAAEDSVVTVLPSEAPHNVNDHASTSGEGILTTIAGTISQTGANVISGDAPYTVVLGPEHAQTIHRDGWTIEAIQEKIYKDSAVHVSRVSKEQRAFYESRTTYIVDDRYHLSRSPEDIQVLVAGGPGKHSAYIPTFGHNEACSVRIAHT
ncbi:MAG: hypothetical protein MJE12_11315 [Alphaproteobacteria bacterium]|nr:hypothetical protein [Alphaproteobacteria bacterium]